ncbi:MAG: taurine catabolism dioxygenase TauD, partial [Alphaproteobacteria bacterium]|nr:taurine catabolism dioxygenase TauD [Alphaproteobacteria bacterium]
MTTGVAPERLETHIAWQAKDVADPESWTVRLSPEDRRELDAALAHAKTVSRDLLDIGLEDFPLDGLAEKLSAIERELI